MKLVPENINEAIKHLKPHDEAEIRERIVEIFKDIYQQTSSLSDLCTHSFCQESPIPLLKMAKYMKSETYNIRVLNIHMEYYKKYEDYDKFFRSLIIDENKIKIPYQKNDLEVYPNIKLAYTSQAEYYYKAWFFNYKYFMKNLNKHINTFINKHKI